MMGGKKTHDVRDLAKGLFGAIFWSQVLPRHDIDIVELIWDAFLMQDSQDAAGTRRQDSAVELENHR